MKRRIEYKKAILGLLITIGMSLFSQGKESMTIQDQTVIS